MHAGIGDFIGRDQFALRIHFHMIFVPIEGLLVLLRPTRFCILLTQLRRILFPIVGNISLFDRLILLPAVSLPWHFHKTRIDDAGRYFRLAPVSPNAHGRGRRAFRSPRAYSKPHGKARWSFHPAPSHAIPGPRTAGSSGGPESETASGHPTDCTDVGE